MWESATDFGTELNQPHLINILSTIEKLKKKVVNNYMIPSQVAIASWKEAAP